MKKSTGRTKKRNYITPTI